MKTRKKIEVKDGNIAVPIYEFGDGRYCVDSTLGLKRVRITRTSLEAAKIEARKIISQIAAGRHQEEPLTIAETEDYRMAIEELKPHKVPLLTVVREWKASEGRSSTKMVSKTVPDIVEEFLTSKSVEGASSFHMADRKHRLGRLADAFPGRIDRITTHEIEKWLNGFQGAGRTRNNYRNATLQLFRYARAKRYLPRNEPTVVEDVPKATAGEGAIEIYTPQELRLLLEHAPKRLVTFFVLGAFAGLRSQESMRLEWKDIRFEQTFIEVSAAKAKTASRRLVPLLPVLASWLLPFREKNGRVAGYAQNHSLSEARTDFCKTGIVVNGEVVPFTWKSNALRHSYASYRLAEIKDAARVALEMGNSPSMLFRNYRELVTEQQAAEWFSLTRSAVRPGEPVLAAVA